MYQWWHILLLFNDKMLLFAIMLGWLRVEEEEEK